MKGYYKNLKGKRFGHLTVLDFDSKGKSGKSHWLVRCDCGKEKTVMGYLLTAGNTKSCGCAHREYMKTAIGTHIGRLTGAKWYSICSNAKRRDIEVNVTQKQVSDLFSEQDGKCALSGVELVLDAPRPKITASLDRIDSTRGYEMDNVRWIHKDINKMKNDFDDVTFLAWIAVIAKQKLCAAN